MLNDQQKQCLLMPISFPWTSEINTVVRSSACRLASSFLLAAVHLTAPYSGLGFIIEREVVQLFFDASRPEAG